MPTDLTVVVMAYNEAAGLRSVVEGLADAAQEATPHHQILIIDDGSADETGRIADDLAAGSDRIEVIHHLPNQGLGGVYRTGFATARGEMITFFPADGQFPPDIVTRFFRRMGGHDILLGYLPSRPSPWIARFLSAMERVLYALLFGGFPRFQGILMFRRALLEQYPLTSRGRDWVVIYELILRARKGGASILSVPTDVRPRAHGRSKVTNLHSAWANFVAVLKLRLRF